MTKKEMIDALKDLPDDTLVFVEEMDGTEVVATTVLSGYWWNDAVPNVRVYTFSLEPLGSCRRAILIRTWNPKG
jgi:hypothetical protein